MEAAEFVSFVQINHKHDQLSHTPAGALGHTAPPLLQLMWLKKGSPKNQMQMIDDPVCDSFYEKAINTTNLDEIRQILRDANEYVARQHFSFSLVQPNTYSLVQPWFKGYNGQSLAITGTGSGPSCMGFYMCRFWIDQKLKTSSGH